MSVRIILVDDHEIVRQGLRMLLHTDSNLELVADTGNGRDAVRLATELSPDVMVMDIAMPALNGVDATRQILSIRPTVKIVAMSAHIDSRTGVNMIQAGAVGLVPKLAAFDELKQAIRTVIEGKVYISPQLPADVAAALKESVIAHHGNGVFGKITAREREVLQLMAEGRSTKQIAADLALSAKTIETHRRQLMSKLGLDNIAALTKYAVREGLTTL